MGSMAEALRHLVRSVGGKRARETAEQAVEEKQRPRYQDSGNTFDPDDGSYLQAKRLD